MVENCEEDNTTERGKAHCYLFLVRDGPAYFLSDNDSQFTDDQVKMFLKDLGVVKLFIEPGCPWEDGCGESFISRKYVELLDGELFYI